MAFADFTSCKMLCLNEKEYGCCYLKTGFGCYWRSNSYATDSGTGSGTAIAITCTSGLINWELS